MVTIKDAIAALSKCSDPELDANIVDIGLIYGLTIDKDNNISLKLTMTSPMCPVTSIILADAEMRLEAIPGVKNVDVELVWEPAWRPDMMVDDLKYRD